jgi:7-carboxy-7-deazaguanine synthase
MEQLLIHEIYASIQGESRFAGFPCVFVRLTGCPLRCRWCDTVHAFQGGELMSLDEIVKKIDSYQVPMVELTGGEPLAQKASSTLMGLLVQSGYQVLIETSGSEDISCVPNKVHIIMDLKAPGSRMEHKNRWENLEYLKETDDIKVVIADRQDFDWTMDVIDQRKLVEKYQILLSCAWGQLNPKELSEWILAHPLGKKCRLQLQQHKYIWNPRARGV